MFRVPVIDDDSAGASRWGGGPVLTHALAVTYEHQRERLKALASRYTAQDAEDIVQDAFVRALQHRAQFRYDAALSTWLHRIVVNECISRYRRRRRRLRADLLHGHEQQAGVKPISIETIAVRKALQRLPDQEHRVLIMHDIMGHTHREIAATLQIPDGTCKWLLSVARRRLQTLS